MMESLKSGDFSSALDVASKEVGDKINDLVVTGLPNQITYGFATGYASGVAMKKIGKIAAGSVGAAFVCLQWMSYNGYVKVEHKNFKEKFYDLFGSGGNGKDGEGKKIDVAKKWSDVMDVVGYNVPAGTGFTAGIICGLRTS